MFEESFPWSAFWRFLVELLLLRLGLLLEGAEEEGVAFVEDSFEELVLDLGVLWRKVGRFQPLEVAESLIEVEEGGVSSLKCKFMLLSSVSPILVLSCNGMDSYGSVAPKDVPSPPISLFSSSSISLSPLGPG